METLCPQLRADFELKWQVASNNFPSDLTAKACWFVWQYLQLFSLTAALDFDTHWCYDARTSHTQQWLDKAKKKKKREKEETKERSEGKREREVDESWIT